MANSAATTINTVLLANSMIEFLNNPEPTTIDYARISTQIVATAIGTKPAFALPALAVNLGICNGWWLKKKN